MNNPPISSRMRNCSHCPFNRLTVTNSIPNPLKRIKEETVAKALRKPVSSALRLVRAINVMLGSGSFLPSSRAVIRTTARYKFTATAQCHPHILPKNNTSTSTAAPKATNRIRNGCLSLGSSVLFWSLKPPPGSSAASFIFPSVILLFSITSFLEPCLLLAVPWVRQYAGMISPAKLLSLSIPIHVCKNLAKSSHSAGDG